MGDGNITLKLSGSDARNGQVPAEAFTSAIRKFAATVAYFERIYTTRARRTIDLNVAYLARENPLVVGLAPAPRVRGYSPAPAIRWAFGQMANLSILGGDIDPRIPVELLDNVFDLSDADSREGITKLVADYEGNVIDFNGSLAQFVRARRTVLVERMAAPTWYAGVSRGTIFGELRGVTDIDGEREFFVCPPSGPRRVKCVFTEPMRDQMNRLLFKTVRITGFLHYDGSTPHAALVEAESIIAAEEPTAHMLDMEGLFKDSFYPLEERWPQ